MLFLGSSKHILIRYTNDLKNIIYLYPNMQINKMKTNTDWLHKSTCFELTSWSSFGLSLITFHCSCSKALCLSSYKYCKKYIYHKCNEINLSYHVLHTLDFWRCNSSSSFRHSSSSSHLNALI